MHQAAGAFPGALRWRYDFLVNKKQRDPEWARAKRLCRLSAEDVRKAKELGFSPRGLIKNIPSKSQRWKAPVHIWVRDLYEERHPETWHPPRPARLREPIEFRPEDDFWHYDDYDAPDKDEIAEENCLMRNEQDWFRRAAEYVAEAFSRLPVVQKVVLFGSVAAPLKKEVPRFRKFRQAGVAIFHECKDVDLAVWLPDLSDLKSLQRARGQALNDLFAEMEIGVAHHQVDVFLMEPGTDRYLGRLCCFGQCPKGKPDCLVAGCGAPLFLRQLEDFHPDPDALKPDRTTVVFERGRSSKASFERDECPF